MTPISPVITLFINYFGRRTNNGINSHSMVSVILLREPPSPPPRFDYKGQTRHFIEYQRHILRFYDSDSLSCECNFAREGPVIDCHWNGEMASAVRVRMLTRSSSRAVAAQVTPEKWHKHVLRSLSSVAGNLISPRWKCHGQAAAVQGERTEQNGTTWRGAEPVDDDDEFTF